MAKLSKKMLAAQKKIDCDKLYSLDEGIALLQDLPRAKFSESVDGSFNLGVDPRKADQNIRGSVVLPHGTGKTKRVAVLAEGQDATVAEQAGADLVAYEDLVQDIKQGKINFDILITTPPAMRLLGPVGQILGPKGLMPNPKDGTVTQDIKTAVESAKKGQIKFRADKAGIIHCPLGKVDFNGDQLKENFKTMFSELQRLKPSSSKGLYFKKVSLSTTMGPGIRIDLSSVSA